MKVDKYIEISGLVFIVVAILHLVRASAGWPLVINGYGIPTWVSWVVVILIGFLAYQSLEIRDQKMTSNTSKASVPAKKTTRRKATKKTTRRKTTKK